MLLRLVSLDGSYIEVRANQPMWKHNEYHQYAGLCSKLLTKLKAAFPRILTNNMSWVPAIFFSQLLQLVIAIHSINQSIEHRACFWLYFDQIYFWSKCYGWLHYYYEPAACANRLQNKHPFMLLYFCLIKKQFSVILMMTLILPCLSALTTEDNITGSTLQDQMFLTYL